MKVTAKNKKYRDRGTGTIYKKKNGKYCLQYKDTVLNKVKTVTLKDKYGNAVTTKREAIILAGDVIEKYQNKLRANSEEKHQIAINEIRSVINADKNPIKTIWDDFEFHPSRKTCSEKTNKLYKHRITTFSEWVNKKYGDSCKYISDLNDDIAQEYATELRKQGLANKTYNETIAILRRSIGLFMKDSNLKENPFREKNIIKQDVSEVSRKEFTEDELTSILDAFENGDIQYRDSNELEILFHLGAWTGLRLKDCALIQWNSIDFSENEISLVPFKTRKHKTVVHIPLHPLLREKLSNAMEWKENDYVLPNIASRYNNNSVQIAKAVKRVLKKCGFESEAVDNPHNRKLNANKYGFHSLRHSFVSFCAKAKVPLTVVQEIVGHKNPAITAHYAHNDKETREKAINALPLAKDQDSATRDQLLRLAMTADISQVKQAIKILEG